ncbi:MAG: hypothetical protein RLZZ58_2178, partial [Pseudomonadota bacterium]
MSAAAALRNLVRYARAHPVGKRQPWRVAARILRWQLTARLSPGPSSQRWISGTRLVVERGMAGATGNLYFGLHEFADMGFMLHLLRADDFFLDIGANVGT